MKKILLAIIVLFAVAGFAQTFTITTTTTAWGAGTPSKAITLQITGTTGSTTTFTMTDGGASGTFCIGSAGAACAASGTAYTIAAGTNGSIQFVYIPASGASGTITLQAVATGGISATHTLALPIGTATSFAQDNFSGTNGTALIGRTAQVGGVFTGLSGTGSGWNVALQDGSNHVYSSASGANLEGIDALPVTPSSGNEQDITGVVKGFDSTTDGFGIGASWNFSAPTQSSGYKLVWNKSGTPSWHLFWQTNTVTAADLGTSTSPSAPTGGATVNLLLAIRVVNSTQYVWGFVGSTRIGPFADSHVTTPGYPFVLPYNGAGTTSTGQVLGTFAAKNPNWTPNVTAYTITGPTSLAQSATGTFTVTPNGVYSGTITLSDGVSGGTFTPTTLTWVSSSSPKTFTYANSSLGSYTLTGSSSPSITNGTIGVAVRTAANFFVSAAGSDSNNGTSTGTPWQTISKVNSSSFVPGDTISFRCGDTFTGAPLTPTLVGTQSAPISVGSYGTCGTASLFAYLGLASVPVGVTSAAPIISCGSGNGLGTSLAGNPNFISSGVGDCFDITAPDFVNVSNIKFSGDGWTGSFPTLTFLNNSAAIQITCGRTTGQPCRGLNFSNIEITGVGLGISANARASASDLGFNGFTVTNSYFHDITFGAIWAFGNGADAAGTINQVNNQYIAWNKISNMPGNPQSGGTGGAPLLGAEPIQVGSGTGITVENNSIDTGGYSTSALSSVCALVATNARDVHFFSNEIAHQNNYGSGVSDNCAMDFDQDVQNSEVAFNFTHDNPGAFFQQGSFGGKTTGNNWVHDNISRNDERANGIGAFRLWGNTTTTVFEHNTIDLETGYSGSPAIINCEAGSNTGAIFLNNIFKTNGTPIFNTIGSCTTPVTIGNIYDFSGGAVLYSTGKTSLSAWQAIGSGYENLNGITYGSQSSANLNNLTFSGATSFVMFTSGGIQAIHNFDLTSSSTTAIGTGVNPELVVSYRGIRDFHGTFPRTGTNKVLLDLGASAYPQPTSTGGGSGPGSIVIQ